MLQSPARLGWTTVVEVVADARVTNSERGGGAGSWEVAVTSWRDDGTAGWAPPRLWAHPPPDSLPLLLGRVAEWQTRWLQVPVRATSWGFKSPLAHHEICVADWSQLRRSVDSTRSLLVHAASATSDVSV